MIRTHHFTPHGQESSMDVTEGKDGAVLQFARVEFYEGKNNWKKGANKLNKFFFLDGMTLHFFLFLFS